MKIAKKDIALIMIVLGLVLVFCSFKFAFSPALDKVDEEKSKQAELQTKIDEVKKVAGTEPDMEKEIAGWTKEIEDMLAKYHAAYSYEDGILWMKQIEDAGTASGNPVISAYTVNEIGAASLTTTVEGQGAFSGKVYGKGTTSYSFDYAVADYNSLKSFLDYIVTASNREGVKTIDNMSFAVDDKTGEISGSVNMTVYSVTDLANVLLYKLPSVDGVNQGVSNIFGEPTGVTE